MRCMQNNLHKIRKFRYPQKMHPDNHEEKQKNSLSQRFPILFQRLTNPPHQNIITTPPSFKEINLKKTMLYLWENFHAKSKFN